MIQIMLTSILGVGLVILGLLWFGRRRVLDAAVPVPPEPLPRVSILKPLKGRDENLAGNLESAYRQDYPDFEVICAVRDEHDPAIAVVRAVASRHPGVRTRLVVSAVEVGRNPKVNNLANALEEARNDLLLISDSNVRLPPDHLRHVVSLLIEPGVGLVSAPVTANGGSGVGGALESYHLNTFVLSGVAATDRVLRLPCVMGKSMLLRREHLRAMGGFAFLGRFLAEDQVSGEEIRRMGLRTRLCPVPVANVLGRLTFREFVGRHLRWARIRRRMCPAGYAGEILANPVFLAVLGALVAGSLPAVLAAAALLFLSAGLGARAERALGIRRPLLVYPALELARSLATGLLHVVPFLSSRVTWRGNRFHLGPRTELGDVRTFSLFRTSPPLHGPDRLPRHPAARGSVSPSPRRTVRESLPA
ncbi:MAG: ceramide glucosyltransferase [Planctomycetes bacterium]|nr:ceramide glucosyltransferase [Planctomycetota bacterium]